MAKAFKPPSKVQQAKEERKWRAECMVKDAFMATPAAKKQVSTAMKEMAKMETHIKAMVKPGAKPAKKGR